MSEEVEALPEGATVFPEFLTPEFGAVIEKLNQTRAELFEHEVNQFISTLYPNVTEELISEVKELFSLGGSDDGEVYLMYKGAVVLKMAPPLHNTTRMADIIKGAQKG